MEDNHPDNKTATIELDNGTKFTFSSLTAWDLVATTKELGSTIQQAEQFEASMVLAWRSAVQGGFKGSFEEFMSSIPYDRISEVVECATPFLATSNTPNKPDQAD
tara:strand:- start:535 stop:849 length:315 start_codon:yes stop_codon:yes gene_type:complete